MVEVNNHPKIMHDEIKLDMIEEIHPDYVYDMKQVHDLRLIPWANNYATLRRLVDIDKERGDILKTKKTGQGTRIRYEIQGINIINYVKKYGPGAMLMFRKPKQHIWQPKQKVRRKQ